MDIRTGLPMGTQKKGAHCNRWQAFFQAETMPMGLRGKKEGGQLHTRAELLDPLLRA